MAERGDARGGGEGASRPEGGLRGVTRSLPGRREVRNDCSDTSSQRCVQMFTYNKVDREGGSSEVAGRDGRVVLLVER